MPDQSAIAPTQNTAPSAPPIWQRSAGLVPYPDATDAMQRIVEGLRDGSGQETIWLLEHPPTFTAGTSARAEDLFNPAGFPTFEAGRGGQWTYHGPGQRVGYVMLDLARPHGPVPPRDVRAYVCALEGWLIASLAMLSVTAGRRSGRVGVWVQDERTGADHKIAALGVRVTRWICFHGVSINLAPALDHFDGIVPCGIREHGVTSLAALGHATTMAMLDDALAACWPASFGGPVPTILAA